MPLPGATVQGYVRTLKAFSSWAIREEYIPPGHFGRIPVPKAQSKIINAFSSEQVKQLVSPCQMSNRNGRRNLAILLLSLDTGLFSW
jgi:site-specific recombinase XerD